MLFSLKSYRRGDKVLRIKRDEQQKKKDQPREARLVFLNRLAIREPAALRRHAKRAVDQLVSAS